MADQASAEQAVGVLEKLISAGQSLGPASFISATLIVCVAGCFVAWLWWGKKEKAQAAAQGSVPKTISEEVLLEKFKHIDGSFRIVDKTLEDIKEALDGLRQDHKELVVAIDAKFERTVSKDLLEAKTGSLERAMLHFIEEMSAMLKTVRRVDRVED